MSPFLQTRGGGSAQGYKASGGAGGPDGLTQATAAINAHDLMVNGGQTANGYYWIKGNGDVSNARQFYCILDTNWMSCDNLPNQQSNYGWIIQSNHDAQKAPNGGHQPRPTSYNSQVGGDNGLTTNGGMWTNKSFSQNMVDIPFRVMMHFVYSTTNSNPDNWLTAPQGYYYLAWNSDQTIPNQQAWGKQADYSSYDHYLRMNGSVWQRRLYDNNTDSYQFQGAGVLWNNGGGNPYHVGNSGSTQNYPNYIASGGTAWNGGQGSQSAFSWCDTGDNGWDDWQDGAGMGDTWDIENIGANAYRGNPSAIAFH